VHQLVIKNFDNNRMHGRNVKKSELRISLFLGLALGESLNVFLLYMCNMQNAYNHKPNYNFFFLFVQLFKCGSVLAVLWGHTD